MEEYNPENPLPDSDLSTLVDAEEVVTLQDVPRRTWNHSDDFTVVTVVDDGVTVSYDLSSLPTLAQSYLMTRGFSAVCAAADSPAAAFDKLMKAERLGVRGKSATGRKVKVNPWHEAIALSIVDATHEANRGQKTIQEAREIVLGMAKENIAVFKRHPNVVTHYNKLTGKTVGSSLVDFLAEAA